MKRTTLWKSVMRACSLAVAVSLSATGAVVAQDQGNEQQQDQQQEQPDQQQRQRDQQDQQDQQSQQDEGQAGQAHTGRVAGIEDGALVMTIDGKNRHTHQVPDDAKITIDGERAGLQDLREGDRIRVRTEKNNPKVAVAIEATRGEAAQQRDQDQVERRTFRSRDEQRPQRDRQARGDQQGEAWLGIYLAEDQDGVRVVEVQPGSPAARAGLRPGDLLLAMDGDEFRSAQDVSEAVGQEQPGANVEFTVERAGQERSLQARLGNRPQVREERGLPPGFPGGRDAEQRFREFRGFGPDRQLMQEHQQIQREHEQLKEQVQNLQQQLRQLRQELNQLKQGNAGQRNQN